MKAVILNTLVTHSTLLLFNAVWLPDKFLPKNVHQWINYFKLLYCITEIGTADILD